jgi:hypothetical protein
MPAMEQRHTPWCDRLPGEWFDLGRKILQARGIEELHYQNKTIKERLLDSMAVPNILALVESARRSMGGTDGEEVVERLGLHRGTPNRWLKNESQPHARLFFGLLTLGLRKEIHEVNLPRNREVLWQAISRTIAIIREKECGRDRRCPSREEFAFVRLLMRHPHSDVLLGNRHTSTEKDVLRDVLRVVRSQFSGEVVQSAEDAQRTAAEWLRPYLLFRIGLLHEWEFLDDEVV